MKILITMIASCIVLIGCGRASTPTLTDATLQAEMKEFEKPSVGKVRIEATYRGKERILMVMSYSNITTRAYYLHGKPVYVESDANGDGFFETVMIAGDSMEDFEQFTRKSDGMIEPISKEKYLEQKQKVNEAGERMKQALKKVGK